MVKGPTTSMSLSPSTSLHYLRSNRSLKLQNPLLSSGHWEIQPSAPEPPTLLQTLGNPAFCSRTSYSPPDTGRSSLLLLVPPTLLRTRGDPAFWSRISYSPLDTGRSSLWLQDLLLSSVHWEILWNSLPDDLRTALLTHAFKTALKPLKPGDLSLI